MEFGKGERASARMSEFGRTAAAIDELERASAGRVGGETEAERRAFARLHERLFALPRETAWDWMWVAGKLSRAHMCDWGLEAVLPYIRLVGDPMTVGCKP